MTSTQLALFAALALLGVGTGVLVLIVKKARRVRG